MNDSPSLFLIKVEDFLCELCGSVVLYELAFGSHWKGG